MFCWIITPIVTILAWEYFGMGLDWHGMFVSEFTRWGKTAVGDADYSKFVRWSVRMGPLEIYRM